MSDDLPEGWAAATLGELFEFKYGKGLPAEKRNPTGSVEVYGSNGIVGLHDRAVSHGQTIIVGRKGSVGEIHLSRSECWPIDTTYYIDEFFASAPPEYWALYLRFLGLGQQEKSSAIPGISRNDIYAAPVKVPPLAEQRRIVAQAKPILATVRSSRQRLDKAHSVIKRFRQAVLAAACSGKLTADWRQENKSTETAADFVLGIQAQRQRAKLDSAASVNAKSSWSEGAAEVDEDAYGLPAGWCVTRICDISDCLDHVRVPVNKNARAVREGSIPYYGANGQVGWIDDYLFDEDLVLVVEDETFIGREKPFSYVIRGKSWVNNHAHVLRAVGGMPVEYLNLTLSYYDFTPLTSGTTGRRKLNQGALRAAPLWIAPLREQVEIVRRTEALFLLADRLEKRCEKAKAQVDRLTQSILAKAFRGELVPTEAELARREGREYETAEQLLSRINSETKAAPANGRPRRTARARRK